MLSFSNSASFIEEIQYGYLLDTRDRLANSMYIPQSATTSASAGFSHQQRNRPEVASDSAQGFDGLSASRDFHSFKDRCGRTFKYHTEADLHALQVYDPKYIGDGNLDSGYTQTEFFSGRGSPYPLHERGFNVNGRLPCDAPQYQAPQGEQVMEDVATQPATQPFFDPRRQGTKSMLSEQDESDVLCILLPSSRPAVKAVDLVAEASPQHILQNHFIEEVPVLENDLVLEPLTSTRQDSDHDNSQSELGTQSNDELRSSHPARDIALRMSSRIHNPCLGFVFGRNPQRCDLIISNDSSIKLSNCHFRIFVNRHGVLMLEDTSMNGTFVDNVLLKRGQDGSDKRTANACARTLNAGAIIELPILSQPREETIRFIVRFPTRDQAQEQYSQNIAAYLDYIQQAKRQLQIAAAGKGDIPPPLLMPFNAVKDKTETGPNASILAAATGDYNHGLSWNGGEKYNVVSYVGKGAFALVFKLSAKKDGEVYACKQIEKRRFIKDGILNHKVHNEILVMKDLEHPNIVKYIEYHETKIHIFIVMEFVGCGDLSSYTNHGAAMPEYMCQIMATQMIQALDYLHKRKITHRDIKPDNILIASHRPCIFKLSDFGLSKIVNNEETFLKSFCGTLLYCAPEIYPGFQRAKLGLHPFKRTRSWEPRKGTQPYEHSVDIWSISAVLFHLLCGHAPYSGSMEDEGASMLMNIMKAPPNWARLAQAGVSCGGIDFIKRTLVVDPSSRARESDLLRHHWIDPQAPRLEENRLHSGGDEADDLDASQLSLADTAVPRESEEEVDDLDDHREAKRSKHFQSTAPETEIDLFRSFRQGRPWTSDSEHQWTANQFNGVAAHQAFGLNPPAQRSRLFGEIGSSALRSSGVLGQDAHVALQVPTEGSYNPSQNEQSYIDPEAASAESVSYGSGKFDCEQLNPSATSSQHHLQYPQLFPEVSHTRPAPSLFGAEALVSQLNMTSPEPGVSETSADSKPASPKAPTGRDALPGSQEEKLSAHSPKPLAIPGTARRAMSRLAENESQNITYSTQSPTADNQPDLQFFLNNTTELEPDPTLNTGSDLSNTQHTSNGSDAQSYRDGQCENDTRQSDVSLLPTAFNSQGSEQYTPNSANAGSKALSPQVSSSQTVTAVTVTGGPVPSVVLQAAIEPTTAFVKPLLRFGNLVPTPGSISTTPIKITAQATTFGRDPKSHFVHPNVNEDRIPKNALDIAMWYPNIERDIALGKPDWHLNDCLTAILSTRTGRYIKVNGIRLMKGSGCWLYGKLKTGDVITVFGPPEGADTAGTDNKQKEYLRFRCEFFVGQSKEPRSPDEPFVVEKEEEKYKRYEVRKSRESSAGNSREGSVAAIGGSARSGKKGQSGDKGHQSFEH